MTDVVGCRLRSSNYFGADHFELIFRLGSYGPFWSDQTVIDVDIRLRETASSSYVSAVQGRVDQIRLDVIGDSVFVEGRDYSASLIDTTVSETFTNRTASDIVAIFAQRHGLQPSATPTGAIVGRYYQNQHDVISLDDFCGKASEWDFLCYLAQHENYDLFVSGTTLNFLPTSASTTVPCTLGPEDAIELRLDRILSLAGGIEVVVKTWNSRLHAAETRTASRAHSAASGIVPIDPRRIVLVRPNLTSDAAQQLAQRKLAELCAHDRSIELLMPGELTLSPRSVINLQGTGTEFDQSYRINVIDRSFSPARGFLQRIRASNIYSPQ